MNENIFSTEIKYKFALFFSGSVPESEMTQINDPVWYHQVTMS